MSGRNAGGAMHLHGPVTRVFRLAEGC